MDSKKTEVNSVSHLIYPKSGNLASRSNSRAFNTPSQPCILNAIPVAKHTDRTSVKLTNGELFIYIFIYIYIKAIFSSNKPITCLRSNLIG